MQSPPPGSFVRFSTDGMSEREAIAYWREFLGGVVAKIDITPVDRENFHQANTFLILPDMRIAFGTTSGMVGQRTRALTADGNDDLVFTTNLSAGSVVVQRSQELELGTGQAALLSFGDASSHILPKPAHFLNFAIPRSALRDRVGNIEDAMMRAINADNAALRLLVDYVALATGKHAPLSADLQSTFGVHVLDLVALTLGATRDGAALAQGRGVRAARRAEVLNHIATGFSDAGLSAASVAAKLGVTPRYVHLLLDRSGLSFSQHLNERRLAAARAMLADPRQFHLKIADIAYAAGFSDVSHFNRSFRQRFGMTPSDVRAQTMRDGAS